MKLNLQTDKPELDAHERKAIQVALKIARGVQRMANNDTPAQDAAAALKVFADKYAPLTETK